MSEIHDLVVKLKAQAKEQGQTPSREEFCKEAGVSDWKLRHIGGYSKLLDAAGLVTRNHAKKDRRYKILVVDIELFPMCSYHWDLWPERIDQKFNIEDWSVACWTAKWYGEERIIYRSVQKHCPRNKRNDREILEEMRDLLDEADVVLTQNGKKFDIKKLTAKFIKYRIKPPSRFLQLDTKLITKRIAALSSNSLAWMSQEINEKYKKLEHKDFPGNSIFVECMRGNTAAWTEMRKYNMYDVLATEEYYSIIAPYDQTINWNVFHHGFENQCFCGSKKFYRHETKKKHTRVGKYSLFICHKCGRDWALGENELTKDKRQNMLR